MEQNLGEFMRIYAESSADALKRILEADRPTWVGIPQDFHSATYLDVVAGSNPQPAIAETIATGEEKWKAI